VRIEGEPDIACDMSATVVEPTAPGSKHDLGCGSDDFDGDAGRQRDPYVVDAKPGLLSAMDLPLTLPRHAFR
jgi:hypothetical protein